MSTYTKKTVIIWEKNSYASSMISADGQTPSTPAFNEFNEKTQQMIADGVMDADAGSISVKSTTVRSVKLFADQDSAAEWVRFNDELATKYGFTKLSSNIFTV